MVYEKQWLMVSVQLFYVKLRLNCLQSPDVIVIIAICIIVVLPIFFNSFWRFC